MKQPEKKTKETPKASEKHIVAIPFFDAPEYQVGGVVHGYIVGEDVSHLDSERLKNLVERGAVTKQ